MSHMKDESIMCLSVLLKDTSIPTNQDGIRTHILESDAQDCLATTLY